MYMIRSSHHHHHHHHVICHFRGRAGEDPDTGPGSHNLMIFCLKSTWSMRLKQLVSFVPTLMFFTMLSWYRLNFVRVMSAEPAAASTMVWKEILQEEEEKKKKQNWWRWSSSHRKREEIDEKEKKRKMWLIIIRLCYRGWRWCRCWRGRGCAACCLYTHNISNISLHVDLLTLGHEVFLISSCSWSPYLPWARSMPDLHETSFSLVSSW